jgi:hypothetical protein
MSHALDRSWDSLSDSAGNAIAVARTASSHALWFTSARAFCIRRQIPPFHYIIMNGRHIHHLVPGILILLAVGFGWLCEFGTGSDSSSLFASHLMSLLYGVGAALTLDEFALWLNLKDVYFAREGRSSLDAVVLFGSLLAIGGWGAPLFAALAKRMTKQSG